MQSNYLNKDWETSLLENCFVMYPKTLGSELMKYAVIELVLAGVLTLKREKRRPNPQAPITRYFYLKRGPHFDSSKLKLYHRPIVQIFKHQKNYLPLRNFGEKVTKHLGGNINYYKSQFVNNSMKREGLLNFYFLFRSFSRKGKSVKSNLKPNFKFAEKRLNSLLINNIREAIDLINQLDTDLILMDDLSHKSAKKIHELIAKNTEGLKEDLNIRKINFIEVFEFENSFTTSIDFSTFIG
jgi:hypothetical protein